MMPVPKVTAAVVGGVVATVLVALLKLVDVEFPAEVAAACATIFAFIAGYLQRA